MPLTREEVFALIDEKIFTNNSAQIQAADVNALLKTIYDNAPNTGFEHYIGEAFGGGVIFHLWKDSEGVEHGLVVDLNNLTNSTYSNVTTSIIGSIAQSSWNGLQNSNAIVAQSGHNTSAAKLCLDSTAGDQTDWYLPSILELSTLFDNRLEVNRTITFLNQQIIPITNSNYMSSTEVSSTNFFSLSPSTRSINDTGKGGVHLVRAIRQF